jgi:hypothetical protein
VKGSEQALVLAFGQRSQVIDHSGLLVLSAPPSAGSGIAEPPGSGRPFGH